MIEPEITNSPIPQAQVEPAIQIETQGEITPDPPQTVQEEGVVQPKPLTTMSKKKTQVSWPAKPRMTHMTIDDLPPEIITELAQIPEVQHQHHTRYSTGNLPKQKAAREQLTQMKEKEPVALQMLPSRRPLAKQPELELVQPAQVEIEQHQASPERSPEMVTEHQEVLEEGAVEMNMEDFVDVNDWVEMRFAPSRALAPGQEAPPNFRWKHEKRTLPPEPQLTPQLQTSTPVTSDPQLPDQVGYISDDYTYASLLTPPEQVTPRPLSRGSSWDSLLNTSSNENRQPDKSKSKTSKPRVRWSEHQQTYTVSTYTSSVSSVPEANQVTGENLVKQAAGATSQEERECSGGSSYCDNSSGGGSPPQESQEPQETLEVFQICELLGTDEGKYWTKLPKEVEEDQKILQTSYAESIGDSDLEEFQARAIWGVYQQPPPPGLEGIDAKKMDLTEPPRVTNVFREKVHPPANRDTCVMLMNGDILRDTAVIVVLDVSADLNMPGWDVRRRTLWQYPGLEDLIWKQRVKAGRVLKVLGPITEGKLFYVIVSRVKWLHPIGAKELDYFATLKEVFKDIQQDQGETEIAMTLPSVPSLNGRRFQIARCIAVAGRGTGLHVRLYQSF
jgi:hypothetical protein